MHSHAFPRAPRCNAQHPVTAPERSLARIGALVAALALLSSNACTSSLDACSSDADCPKGQTCLLASSGWVESSRCVPIEDCEDCNVELDAEIDSDLPDEQELDEVSETEQLEEAEIDQCNADCTLEDPPPGQLRCLSSNPSSICAVSCEPLQPWRDCNLDPSDGCEIDTSTNAEHCSACQAACTFPNAEASCELSTCTMGACLPNHFDLDGSDSNGCELLFEQNASIVLNTLRPGLTNPRGLCHNGELLSFCATDNNQAILGVCQAEDCHYLNVPACEQTQCSDSLVFTLGGLYLNSYAVDSLPPEPISSRFPFYIDNDYAGARISARKLGNRTLLASVAPSARIAAHYWVEAGSLDPHCSGTGSFLSCDAGPPTTTRTGLSLVEVTALDENTPLIVAAGESIQHARFDTDEAKLYWLEPTPFDTQTEDAVPELSLALASLSGDEAVAPGFALLDQRYLTLFRYVRAPDALPHAYRLTARLELAALLEAHALLALNPTTLAFAASNSVRQSIFFVHSEEPSVLGLKQSEVFGENVDPHRPLSELAVSPRGDELCALRGSELICFTLGFD